MRAGLMENRAHCYPLILILKESIILSLIMTTPSNVLPYMKPNGIGLLMFGDKGGFILIRLKQKAPRFLREAFHIVN